MHTLNDLRSGALIGTRRLDLSCGLTHLPAEVFDLADSLEVLNLSGNQLSSLPHDLPRLKKLKVIFCSDNPFTELPEVLGECASLQVVGFKACQIGQVAANALPPSLRWLILTDNALRQLPNALGERPALQKLMLAGNQLQALPDSLAQASRLELIRLSANRLTQLPGWLFELPRLSWLALSGNPLGWPVPIPVQIPQLNWQQLSQGRRLGEGASGEIFQVQIPVHDSTDYALKIFKGSMTSDGLPEHELLASLVAEQHASLCTPVAEVHGHPSGAPGLLLPLIPPDFVNLAGPPSLESCTRDVYSAELQMDAPTALQVAVQIATAVSHLHRRGVMHGDLYGHNILWNPATGRSYLTDFGAATLLPVGDRVQAQRLQAFEVRAYGCLVEELLALIPANVQANETMAKMRDIALACLDTAPSHRPCMDAITHELQLRFVNNSNAVF